MDCINLLSCGEIINELILNKIRSFIYSTYSYDVIIKTGSRDVTINISFICDVNCIHFASVVRVQASLMDVRSDVTIQRYSFFDLHSWNDNHMYIFCILYFLARFTSIFLMFQSYRELMIITLQLAYRNMFSRFFTFNHYNWLDTSIECFHRLFM